MLNPLFNYNEQKVTFDDVKALMEEIRKNWNVIFLFNCLSQIKFYFVCYYFFFMLFSSSHVPQTTTCILSREYLVNMIENILNIG